MADQPAEPQKPATPLDPAAMAAALADVVGQAFAEHARWNQGYLEWSNNQTAMGQPVPMQADMDFQNRQQWFLQYLQRFATPAALLKSAGDEKLSATLAGYADGIAKIVGSFQAAQTQMATDNANAGAAIASAYSNINATNLAAAAANAKLSNDTFAENFRLQSEMLEKQRASFEAMNKKWMGTI